MNHALSHNKQHNAAIFFPLIALQIGGGTMTGLSIIESVLQDPDLSRMILNSKANVDMYIYIMLPRVRGKVFHNILVKKSPNVHVYGYVFTTILDFLAKYIKIVYHMSKKLSSYKKVIMFTATADVENLLPSILVKLLYPRTVFIVLKHGTAKLILKTYTMKMGLLRKLYTILHALLHLVLDALHPVVLTPIPHLQDHYLRVPYPFDLKVDPQDTVMHAHKDIILFIGRLDYKVKQWHEVIIAYSKFIHKYGKKLKRIPLLVICGDGPDRGVVERISTKHSKLIKYCGFVAGETKNSIIRRSIAVLLPSRFETYPITLHEAMSKLVPVIAYKGFWVQSIPAELINKIVFVVENTDEMAETISKILARGIHIDSTLWETLNRYIRSVFDKKKFEVIVTKLLQMLLAM